MNLDEIVKRISKWKENILLAELAVFLHNMGKCYELFIDKQSIRPSASNQYFYDLIAGSMQKWVVENLTEPLPSDVKFQKACHDSSTLDTQPALSAEFKNKILAEKKLIFPEPIHDLISKCDELHGYPIGFFIDFQQERRWFSKQRPFAVEALFSSWKTPQKAGEIDRVLRLAHISHALCSEFEGAISEKKQESDKTFRASAFGFESGKRIEVEKNFLKNYLSHTEKIILNSDLKTRLISERADFYNELAQIFQNVVSETARPKNDCTLWDFAHTAGSFFKAFVAWSILEPEHELWNKLGTEEDREKLPLNLQYLTLSWDYFQFVQSSTKIIDLLSRKAYLDRAITRLRKYLELEVPIANQIFKDENGLVFLAPGCTEQLLEQGDGDSSFRKILEGFFLEQRETPWVERYAELIPDIKTIGIDYPPKDEKKKDLGFGQMVRSRDFRHTCDVDGFQNLWNKVSYDVCPVCGLRPVGYDDSVNPTDKKKKKAQERNVCLVCEERRLERSDDWVNHHENQTIWIDEVCDDNGRAALIVGRFGLGDWFDDELNLGKSISKYISFARARRIWETTADFWKKLFETELVDEAIIEKQSRIKVKPFNHVNLVKGHAFEAEQKGENPARFQIYWDGEYIHLISRNSDKLNAKKELRVYPEEFQGRTVRKQVVKVLPNGQKISTDYTPFIELLREPALAMALVPADRALACVQKIREKYDQEMGKVKDRLPLNLGVVFFPKNTPIAPVIDAGRRMSQYSFGPEKWKIENITAVETHPEIDDPTKWEISFKAPDRRKTVRMKFENALGDGHPDPYHCKLLKIKADKTEVAIRDLKGEYFEPTFIRDLNEGDVVRMAISHFDFIFLDQAAKRFELSLGEGQVTRMNEILDKPSGTRPYLLEDFSQLQKIWNLINQTNLGENKSALQGFRDLLLQKYRAWKIGLASGGPNQAAFEALVQNAIAKEITTLLTEEESQFLFHTIHEGSFFDCMELHLHILKEKINE